MERNVDNEHIIRKVKLFHMVATYQKYFFSCITKITLNPWQFLLRIKFWYPEMITHILPNFITLQIYRKLKGEKRQIS